jgi:ABC-type multidrug transport system fused ATPase/permease subunit
LRDLTIYIPKGTLVGIVGSVGSGKTALLSALLSRIEIKSGSGSVYGNIACCSQIPWPMIGTFETNITFSKDMDFENLNSVIEATNLSKDLNELPDGILTALGENGCNLSGGQKSRVALARAIYMDADIYLLDDSLASLDPSVSESVFHHVIKNLLAHKTVLLVTNQKEYLQKVDMVVVLDQGRIFESGKYSDLIETKGKLFELMDAFEGEDEVSSTESNENRNGTVALDWKLRTTEAEILFDGEERSEGSVKMSVYFTFLKMVGPWYTIAITILFLASVSLGVAALLYIVTSSNAVQTPPNFILIYVILGFLSAFCEVGLTFVTIFGFYFVGKQIHEAAVVGLLKSPISFFESQPIGRIINRMSSDVLAVDIGLINSFANFIFSVYFVVESAIIVIQANLYIALVVIAVIVCSYFVFSLYQRSNRELKRVLSIDSYISQSMVVIPTIKGFGATTIEVATNCHFKLLDEYLAAYFIYTSCKLWIGLRLQILSSFLTVGLVATGLILHEIYPENERVGAVFGLALTAALCWTEKAYRIKVG